MTDDSCPICEAKLTAWLSHVIDSETGEAFSVWRCERCRFGVTRPVPVDLHRYYGENYHGGRHGITTSLCDRRRIRILSHCGHGGRLLDVGCGDGTFLKAAESAGWSVAGVERYPQRSRSLGLTVHEDLDEAANGGPLDCITLWHSLEHLSELDQSLDRIGQLLTDDGCVIVAVPNVSSLQAKLLGRHWLHLDVPRHLFHFSDSALRKLANKHGMTATRLPYTEFEYDLMGWTQSILNPFSRHRDLFFRIIMRKQTQASAATRLVCLTLGTVVCVFALFPSMIGALTGRGGTLIMQMRPQGSLESEDPNHV